MSNTSITTPRGRSTETDFCSWVGQAAPGDILEYHRGFLGIDIAARRLDRHRAEGAAPARPPRRLGLRRRASCTSCSAATVRATSAISRSGGRARGPPGARGEGPSSAAGPSSPSWRRRHDHDCRRALRHLTQAELAERWRVSTRTLDRWRARRQGAGLAEAERPGPLPARGRARLRAAAAPAST